MNAVSQSNLAPGYEPIPGYIIRKPLGAGGFGEVWLAEAPGGLQKAVKFVYGALDERRATRELKSLERIKGVQHPFLLTLERFEVVDGQLVIVTELADGSLEDVFRRHCERGSCGIPRTSLLAYLQDTADALDYLNSKFQLQHLDVKPGNLLMVGGHVKLADFGLLKDLRDVEHSMVGGLTPIYAAPEVFDGRPSSNSDQYSLAVMYQELLTGTRPFDGRTIAQLATQHVHSAPNLEPLPPMDRPIVARALEKNPERRFASCLEFIETLRGAAAKQASFSRSGQAGTASEMGTEDVTLGLHLAELEKVEELPRLASSDFQTRNMAAGSHAMVIGIGGVGAECLHLLRERIARCHTQSPLDLHAVLIDTDAETIEGAKLAEASGRVTPCTTIYTPLKTPHEYRQEQSASLRSVSRRWLYNIPRSKKTEGLRPLGRLAMVDHAKTIDRYLREAIRHLAAVCGSNVPHIYVVASASGGTGGGMIWDICHLARHLLDETGLSAAELIPLVIVPAVDTRSNSPLSVADSYATLTELAHYLKPGNSYPGDQGAGWPSVPAARSPLKQTYVVASRTALERGRNPIEMIADYLWIDSTVAGKLLSVARKSDSSTSDSLAREDAVVRSMGSLSLDPLLQAEHPRLTCASTVKVLRRWYGRIGEAKQIAGAMVESWTRQLQIQASQLSSDAWSPLSVDEEGRWGWLYSETATILANGISRESLDELFESLGARYQEANEQRLAYVTEVIGRVERGAIELLKEGRGDLTSLVECLQLTIETITAASQMHQLAGPRRLTEADEIAGVLKGGVRGHRANELLGTAQEPGPALRYLDLKLAATVDEKIVKRLQLVIGKMEELQQQLKQRAEVVEAALKLAQNNLSQLVDGASDPWRAAGPEMAAYRDKVEMAAAQNYVLTILGFDNLQGSWEGTAEKVNEQLGKALVPLVEAVVSKVVIENQANADSAQLAASLEGIVPAWLVCGGRQRRLLIVGTERERELFEPRVNEVTGGNITTVVLPGASPTLVHEAQRISLGAMLKQLQIAIGSDPKILGRLSSRADMTFDAPPLV